AGWPRGGGAGGRGLGGGADEQREVLFLVCVEDLSYREAADVLGIPIGTVMSRLARARKNLAEAAGMNPGPSRSEITKAGADDRTRV
uniref:sigma factor-like helix-turn-helix DNA-binding protein n=1 Tax=Inquilinus sp. OTU3971 TaxID=3043855 RepID=UPI00313A8BC2